MSNSLQKTNRISPRGAGESASFAIVIPTYNRRTLLANVLATHCHFLKESNLSDVDIVVSDNCSSDGTADLIRGLAARYPFIKLVSPPQHLPTGEENIAFALNSIGHSHVWLFGDDDAPANGAVRKIRKALLDDGCDFVLMNMRSVSSESMEVLKGRNARNAIIAQTEDFDATIEDLVRLFGFQSILACVSSVAFRRQGFIDGDFPRYFGISPIYSHVATYLDGFHGAKCRFLAEPLIDYRHGATRKSNWTNWSRSRSETLGAPWTIGLIRLFRELRLRSKISRSLLFEISEHDVALIFSTWSHVINMLLSSAETALETRDVSNLISYQMMNEILDEYSLTAPDLTKFETARRTARICEVTRALVMPFSSSSLSADDNSPQGMNSLPYVRRILDKEAQNQISQIANEWFTTEISFVRSLFARPVDSQALALAGAASVRGATEIRNKKKSRVRKPKNSGEKIKRSTGRVPEKKVRKLSK